MDRRQLAQQELRAHGCSIDNLYGYLFHQRVRNLNGLLLELSFYSRDMLFRVLYGGLGHLGNCVNGLHMVHSLGTST